MEQPSLHGLGLRLLRCVPAKTAEFDRNSDQNNENIVMTATTVEAFEAIMPGANALLAITLTSFSTATGEIFDADIVINTAVFPFGVVDDPSAVCEDQLRLPIYDLQNTLVHEVGHFIGFDHTPGYRSDDVRACPKNAKTIKRDLNAHGPRRRLLGVCRRHADPDL